MRLPDLSSPVPEWLRLWSLPQAGFSSQASACVRYWHKVPLHLGSLVTVLRWLHLPGGWVSSWLCHQHGFELCPLTISVFLPLHYSSVPTAKTELEEGALWSCGSKNRRECSLMSTHRSKCHRHLCQHNGEQLHRALGRAECAGFFSQLKERIAL